MTSSGVDTVKPDSRSALLVDPEGGGPPRRRLAGARDLYRRRETWIIFPLSMILIGSSWELAADQGWIDPVFFSRPSEIWDAFVSMYVTNQDIYIHLRSTLRTAGVGFVIAVALGIAIGTITGSVRRLRVLTDPYVSAANALPTVAVLPLLILWFGIGEQAKLVLVVVGAVFNVLVNTQVGVENADYRLIEVAKVFHAKRRQIFAKVMMPAAMPYILAGIRLAVGRALIMTFVAELFMANRGLGFVIADAGSKFQSARLFVGVITLTLIGVLATQAVNQVEKWKFAYGRRA